MAILPKIHSSNLLYLSICVLGIVAFCLVGIYPNTLAMDELEDTIADYRSKIQIQELLYPVFGRLIKEVQQQASDLSVPAPVPIRRDEIARLNQVFAQLAQKNQVKLESAGPDAASYLEDSGSVTMNVAFRGDFFNFQKLLLELCQLPFLTSISQVGVHARDDSKQLEVKLQIRQE